MRRGKLLKIKAKSPKEKNKKGLNKVNKMMNRDAKVNFNNNTIEITKAFAKKAANPMSAEFKELMKLRSNLAGFEVVVKTSVKRTKKDTLKGLNYDFMRQYIERHDDENNSRMVEFERITVKNDDTLATKSYGEVKRWFLEEFPEVAA